MYLLLTVPMFMAVCAVTGHAPVFPPELVSFVPYAGNPVFQGQGPGHWDEAIRERGWILREGDAYHLWYTGYQFPESNAKSLGYATSQDGIHWERYAGNPIVSGNWVEDLMVSKEHGTYYMFAEGAEDQAHLLTSGDRIHWTEQGRLDIRKKNGEPIPPGPFGTPAVLCEDGTWYLFYERNDEAIWLASSKDLKMWINIQDEPVIKAGPEPYDKTMIAVNQVLKYRGHYYAYYHATCPENGRDRWSMNVAVSPDRVHWTKYPGNPIIPPNHSSGILVNDGSQFLMYCMHPSVSVFVPQKSAAEETDRREN